MMTCAPVPCRSPAAESRQRLGSVAARIAGPAAGASLILLGGLLNSPLADAAARACGERDQMLERLAQKYDETPRALGLSVDGGVLEVLVAPDGGWTMLITYPRQPTCVIAVGQAWRSLKLVEQPA